MSQSIQFDQSSIASDDVDVPDNPDDVFEQLISDASRCCQQCYRRLRSRRRFPAAAGEAHGDVMAFVEFDLPEKEPHWNIVDRDWFETQANPDGIERVNPPGEATSRTGCAHCGAVEPHRSPPTRSRAEAIQAALGIISTLQELGAAHNPLVLLVEVSDLKRDPDYAGDDFRTFSTATSRAVRAGRS